MSANYVTAAQVEANHPELAGLVTSWHVELGKEFVHVDAWGTKLSFGHDLIVAHLVAADPGTSTTSSATVTSKSLGSASISYAVPAATQDLDTTSYGRQFLMLRRTLFTTAALFGKRCYP